MALAELLDHEEAIQFIRPGLEQILRVFLKIMDEIDFEDLVGALRKIVEVFEDEIAPFAISLCTKLSEAHIRLSSQKGSIDDEDNETSLTADGLITAIRRVLNSISGKFPELYPQLEQILENSLHLTLTEECETQTEEGLTCIAELIYNQNQVSPTMWGLFAAIIDSYQKEKGLLDPHMSTVSVALINYMVKAPTDFVSANLNGQTPMSMVLSFIQKVFYIGREISDEILSMIGVTLIMALVENVGDAVRPYIHDLNQLYLSELSAAETKDFKNIII